MGSSEDEDRQKWRKIASANPCNIYIGGGCRIWPNFWGDEDLMGLLEKWAWVGLMDVTLLDLLRKIFWADLLWVHIHFKVNYCIIIFGINLLEFIIF